MHRILVWAPPARFFHYVCNHTIIKSKIDYCFSQFERRSIQKNSKEKDKERIDIPQSIPSY
jgi:hypothetical protein